MDDRSLAGMTINERLFHLGILKDWDAAVRRRDRAAMIKLLEQTEVDDPDPIVDAVSPIPRNSASEPNVLGCPPLPRGDTPFRHRMGPVLEFWWMYPGHEGTPSRLACSPQPLLGVFLGPFCRSVSTTCHPYCVSDS